MVIKNNFATTKNIILLKFIHVKVQKIIFNQGFRCCSYNYSDCHLRSYEIPQKIMKLMNLFSNIVILHEDAFSKIHQEFIISSTGNQLIARNCLKN
ncbi:hypothetical protein BpHYR1_045289 [Brachionus plicatilis]|uniref:Uncharacterized protein n=1 Tax=Brachionus plicatilis TaxID=10195 RepID=A0A3M7SNJ7_BRAPC|nr:hypothetical protein BpHYR1_045289 [Brachionus plicatilis]